MAEDLNSLSKKITTDEELADLNRPDTVSVKTNPTIQDLLDANPYRNADYSQSKWQDFLHNLGFRTNADAYRENMAIQAKEYDAAVLQKQYNEQYDSASENAERMREAGLNPDLLGADSGGSSSPMTDDGNPPIPPANDMETVSQFANMIMGAFSGAVGFANSLGSLGEQFLNNESKAMSNETQLFNLAQDIILNSTTRDDFHGNFDRTRTMGKVLGHIERMYPPGGRRYRKFNEAINLVFDSIPTEKKAFDQWLGDMRSRQDATFFSQRSDYDDSFAVLKTIGKYLGQFEKHTRFLKKETEQEAAEAGFREAENKRIYNTELDPWDKAWSENAEAEARGDRAEMITDINDTFDMLLADITKQADKGNKVAAILVALLTLGRLQLNY